MGRRQKGKHMKRKKSWHRLGAGKRFIAADRRLERAMRAAFKEGDR